jgi:tRNA (guanosine-2'-O-)-methyltransferase
LKRDSEDAQRPGERAPAFRTARPGPALPWGAGWSADGVIAALEALVTPARRDRILQVVERRLGSVTLLMDAPHDPHNGAAVIRSCDAFGVQEIHVVERNEPFLVSTRVAQGAERWVDVLTYQAPERALAGLEARGFTLVTSHPEGGLEPDQLATIPQLAIVVGNEHDGICQALTSAAEASVRVPMRGFVESLNVSVSAALLLLAATRARPGDLPDSERRLLYARGLFRSAPRAADVLDALPAR